MKPLFITILGLFVGSFSYGFELSAPNEIRSAEPAACTDFYKNFETFRYHRFANSQGKCFLSATPNDTPDYVYRSYLFTNDGTLMVWVSINEEEYGVSDGARVFTIFPRNQTPTVSDFEGYVRIKSGTEGFEINLDRKSKKIHSVVGANFKEDPKVTPNNAGGFELLNAQFLYLDSGYAVGEDPTGQPNRQAKFVDSNGKTCSVKVGEVFSYKGDNPYVKYSDAELKTWLKTRCPQLTVNF